MWYQKDWFTGSDYYNFRERQISVQELCIINPVEQVFHERTEIYYVRSGKATIWVNGEKFKVRQGSLLCLYMHLFYRIDEIEEPLDCVKVSFHIGLFMFLCFEKREVWENEMLIYRVKKRRGSGVKTSASILRWNFMHYIVGMRWKKESRYPEVHRRFGV